MPEQQRNTLSAEERLDRIEALQAEQGLLLQEIVKLLHSPPSSALKASRRETERVAHAAALEAAQIVAPKDISVGKLKRVEMSLETLIRGQRLAELELPYPEKLLLQRFRLRSQNEEDGLTLALLREAGFGTRQFVEIGCGDNGGNSGFLVADLGWRGLMVDGSDERLAVARREFPQAGVQIVKAWITRDGVNDLLREHGLTGDIDFLSIDIDGNDYWIWEAIDACVPRVVCIEYNSFFGPDRSVILPYRDDFDRRMLDREALEGGNETSLKGHAYGASLRALQRLGEKKGYRLVCLEPRGTNAYFVRDDLAPAIPPLDVSSAFRYLNKYGDRLSAGYDLYGEIAKAGITLVDLDAQ